MESKWKPELRGSKKLKIILTWCTRDVHRFEVFRSDYCDRQDSCEGVVRKRDQDLTPPVFLLSVKLMFFL